MGTQIQTVNSTMQKRLVLGLSAAILLGGMGLAQQRGGTLTVGLSYDIDTLNVYSTGFLGDVQATVAEGLVAPNEKAEYVPVLATRVRPPTVISTGDCSTLRADASIVRGNVALNISVWWFGRTLRTMRSICG